MKQWVLLLAVFLIVPQAQAQIDWNTEEEDAAQGRDPQQEEIPLYHTGMSYAINIGVYFANDVTANYYNGNPNGPNSILRLYNNPNTYAEIRDQYNGNDWYLDGNSLPLDMRYDTPMLFGVNFQYFWNEDFGAFLDFNTAQLVSGGFVAVQVEDLTGPVMEQSIELEEIWGEESRVHVDLGLTYVMKNSSAFQPFISAGIDFLYTEVKTNKVKFGNRTYSILNQGFNGNVNEPQGGMGVGWMFAPGLKLRLNASFSADIGWNFYNTQVRVGDYAERNMNSAAFLRLVYYDF